MRAVNQGAVRKRRCFTAAVLATIALALSPSAARGQGQPQYTKEMIRKVWRQREQQTHSASFEWKAEQTVTKGAISFFWRIVNPRLKDVIPPRDTTFTNTCAASLDGSKIRYEYSTSKWSQKTNRFEPATYLAVFNGSVCKVLYGYGPDHEKTWPQGIVRAESAHVDTTVPTLQPVLMTFRPLTPNMRAYNLDDFELTGRQAIVGGRQCIELEQRIGALAIEKRLWLDPSGGFTVLRAATFKKGVIQHQIDTRFEEKGKDGWIPTEWHIQFNYPNGHLEEAHRAKLSRYELNSALNAAKFELEFPPGTVVSDAKAKTEYVVKPDGSGKRMILRSDIGATYEQVLNSRPGLALQSQATQSDSSNLVLYLLLVAVATTLLCYILVKVRKKTKEGSKQ